MLGLISVFFVPFASQAAGYVWASSTIVGANELTSIAASADTSKLVGVDSYGSSDEGGYIYTSTDGGLTWTERNSLGSQYWSSVTSSSDGVKLAATVMDGYIYTSNDAGVTWSTSTSAGMRSWISITSSASGTELVAAEKNGYIYTSTDGGYSWVASTGAGSRDWIALTSSSDGNKIAAAVRGSGRLYVSKDSGGSWSTINSLPSRNWSSVVYSRDGSKLIAANSPIGSPSSPSTNGYVYISENDGDTWATSTISGRYTWTSVTTSANGTIIVGTTPQQCSGTCYPQFLAISSDGGATWVYSSDYFFKEVISSADGLRLVATSLGNATVYFATPDTTPPHFSVTYSSGTSTSSFSFVTDESATSTLTFRLGGITLAASTLVNSSSFTFDLTDLASCTTYDYTLSVSDGYANSTSTTNSFTTLGCSIASSTALAVTPSGNSLAFGPLTLIFPSGYSTTTNAVQVAELNDTASTAGASLLGKIFHVTVVSAATTTPQTLLSPATLTLSYDGLDLSSINESSITIYTATSTDGAWTPFTGCTLNTDSRFATCSVLHFSVFALFAVPKVVVGNTPSFTVTGRSGTRRSVVIPSAVAPAVLSTSAFIFSRDLTIGSVGDDVRVLQQFLNTHGYPVATLGPGSVSKETSYFGALTQQALSRFQKANSIFPSVGYFGPITRNFIGK